MMDFAFSNYLWANDFSFFPDITSLAVIDSLGLPPACPRYPGNKAYYKFSDL